jgi:hypothetical protein
LVVKSYARTHPRMTNTVAFGFKTRSETTKDPTAATIEISMVLCVLFINDCRDHLCSVEYLVLLEREMTFFNYC